MTDDLDSVRDHYRATGLTGRLKAALSALGPEDQRLAPQQLAALDQFHTRGIAATAELAGLAGITAGMAVLDVGSGIGGPARFLAAQCGCRVVGVDLSEPFVEAARYLTDRTGQGGQVSFQTASALDLPFEDGSFDMVLLQHVAMNIADKPRLYAEVFRVLRPGGRFGLYDLLQGTGGEVLYPAPWAKEARTSFLATPTELRALLEGAGFEILSWRDQSEPAHAWLGEQRRRLREGRPPPLSLAMLLGPDFAAMARNQARNLEEGRVIPTEVICRRR